MPVPVFEEYEPAGDCPCPRCTHQRRTAHRDRPGVRRACDVRRSRALAADTAGGVLAGVTGAVLGPAVPAAAAHSRATAQDRAPAEAARPGSPQGDAAGLHGFVHGIPPVPTTRSAILQRARAWVAARVPYDMARFRGDGYRQDCSGFVSMAWGLGSNVWTGGLAQYGERIRRDQLRPGDILLFHNPADPVDGSHVTVFGGWRDAAHRTYLAYEQTRPHTLARATPYPYWSHADGYVAYRYRGLIDEDPGARLAADAFPGASVFAPGVRHAGIARLGELLAARGYPTGPDPRWTDEDRRAVARFQRAQGWRGDEANGVPGPATWDYLVHGKGRDMPGGPAAAGAPAGRSAGGGASAARRPARPPAPAFPGRSHFGPGKVNIHVSRLSRQLVAKGYGRFYRAGPGPRWTAEDRRAVTAFQRAQGWRGSRADGVPGPETWQRLFS